MATTFVPGDSAQSVGTVQGNQQRQVFSEQANQGPIDAHSISALTDSLALYNLLATLDPSLNDATPDNLAKLTGILKASSNVAANSLENTLDSLRTLFVKNYAGNNCNLNATPTLGFGEAAANEARFEQTRRVA